MKLYETTTRKWGSSLGIIIPKDLVNEEKLKGDQQIKILLVKKEGSLRKLFGIGKGKVKKSTNELMGEMREDLHECD